MPGVECGGDGDQGRDLRRLRNAAAERRVDADPAQYRPITGCRCAWTRRVWSDLYFEATQAPPFRTLREIEGDILPRVLREFAVSADAAPYVDMFFQVTTNVELYPEALDVLNALKPLHSGIVSTADHEHVAAWNFTLPVQFILLSETARAYKPHQRVFQMALDQLGLPPQEVLHVGDSDVDDVKGAKAAGLQVAWVNRDGRPRRPDVPPPDFEIRDLTRLLTLL